MLIYLDGQIAALLDAGAEKQIVHGGGRSVMYTSNMDRIIKIPSATTNCGQK